MDPKLAEVKRQLQEIVDTKGDPDLSEFHRGWFGYCEVVETVLKSIDGAPSTHFMEPGEMSKGFAARSRGDQ